MYLYDIVVKIKDYNYLLNNIFVYYLLFFIGCLGLYFDINGGWRWIW